MNSLKLDDFKSMIYETVNIIEVKKDYLNYINVFPVRDGDTGNNLLTTFNNTKNISNNSSLRNFMNELKNYLLSDARGNSGVIISQFYKGFCNHLMKHKCIGPLEFANAIDKGYRVAYQSVNKPVEGTMLTVLKGASIGALNVIGGGESIVDVILGSFESAQKCLKETINKLPVLKDCGVVDAGGLGVVYMLGAWLRAIGMVPRFDSSLNNLVVIKKEEVISSRYCITVLLKGCVYYKDLKEVLNGLGDSLEIGQEGNLLKIHMHTNDYEDVRNVCFAFGEVSSFEVDDMVEQNEKIKKY